MKLSPSPPHRLVLSACSDFFRTVLRGMGSGRISSSGQNPVLYLRGVTYTDLEAVLNFMYHGEANVAQVFTYDFNYTNGSKTTLFVQLLKSSHVMFL